MSAATLQRLFHVDIVDAPLPAPSWNVKPTQAIPLITGAPPERRLAVARWSLVPPWADDLKLKFPTFNARSESAATKPTFRASVVSKRCIIPFDGYYEWKRQSDDNVPHYVSRSDGAPLSLAGLYSWWQSPQDQAWHLTATILTSAAVGELAALHDRMPVLVHPSLMDEWLDPEHPGTQETLNELVAAQSGLVREVEVRAVNPLRGDGPECIAPRTTAAAP